MKIRQHDGVVVDASELRQGFAKQLREEGGVGEGRGCTRGRVRLPSLSLTIYRGEEEAP